ncbi:hypothetical protein GQ43DRAFT_439718 [Delitschia confertaspora ATCC 74209]|uniref:Uncharacterized protein n=1 Tax=Delitschia confertaspora ATCC 74209 TaxID=1513339 RepID=A0A9P4MWR3_9PLEO|nr:hypothetical protein GQ43DRAFT_439718 [Delitschia confertaspora ATCC 74209]
MLPQHILVFLVATVSAVPLNINLGAYSPALVVGDGEISLGSAERASELIQTLASGAATNAPAEGGQAPANEGRSVPASNAPAPNVRTIEHLGKRAPAPAPEDDSLVAAQDAMEWIKRDIAGFREALGYAREAMKEQPKVELGTGEEGSGVGIIVNGGSNVNKESAANGAKPAGEARRVKRSEVVEESEAPKMTLVAITEV